MEIIQHRINSLSALKNSVAEAGAEIDIRSAHGRLHLAHEPHAPGLSLDIFLKTYRRDRSDHLLVLNPKEDGLEPDILRLITRYRIPRYFFLDLTMPTLVRLATKEKVRQVAVRISEYEPAAAAQRFSGLAEWAWVDCFSGRPPSKKILSTLKRSFKICLVSPELQGFPRARIAGFKPLRRHIDAVCTDFPLAWS